MTSLMLNYPAPYMSHRRSILGPDWVLLDFSLDDLFCTVHTKGRSIFAYKFNSFKESIVPERIINRFYLHFIEGLGDGSGPEIPFLGRIENLCAKMDHTSCL